MGQLNFSRIAKTVRSQRFSRSVRAWVLPVLLTLAILLGVHTRVKADPAPPASELLAYLQDSQLSLFEDSSTGLPQIYYFFNHKPVQLTNDPNIAALHPISSGQYVAYIGIVNGLSQVFVYDVLSDAPLQLSLTSPNEGVSIDGNQLAWQTWDGQNWQIDYFNGIEVKQLTSGGNNSINAQIKGQEVLYATQIGPDDWLAQEYDGASGQLTTIREGDTSSTAYPHFNDDGTISSEFVPQ